LSLHTYSYALTLLLLFPFLLLLLRPPGHSRSIVGVEERSDGSLCLLVLDPAGGLANARKLLSVNAAGMRRVRRFPSNMTHRQYQVVSVDQAVLSPEEKQVRGEEGTT